MWHKSLYYALGEIDPSDSHLMTFDLDQAQPHIPFSVPSQILATIRNFFIHQCIINEDTSTYFMSNHVW